MRPRRIIYQVRKRSTTGVSLPVMQFKTALDLDRIRGLKARLKKTFGPEIKRVSA